MSEFASLWTEASRDIEAEDAARKLANARAAAAGVWPFLAASASWRDYQHRRALAVSDNLIPAAEANGISVHALAESFDRDFTAYVQQRTAAHQAAKTAVRKRAFQIVAESSDDDSGSGDQYYVVDKDSGKDVGGPYDSESDAQDAVNGGDFDEDASDLSVQDGPDGEQGGGGDDSDDADGGADSSGSDGSDGDSDADDSDGGSDSGSDDDKPAFLKGSSRTAAGRPLMDDAGVHDPQGSFKPNPALQVNHPQRADYQVPQQGGRAAAYQSGFYSGHTHALQGNTTPPRALGERGLHHEMGQIDGWNAAHGAQGLMQNYTGVMTHGSRVTPEGLLQAFALPDGVDPLEWVGVAEMGAGAPGAPEKPDEHNGVPVGNDEADDHDHVASRRSRLGFNQGRTADWESEQRYHDVRQRAQDEQREQFGAGSHGGPALDELHMLVGQGANQMSTHYRWTSEHNGKSVDLHSPSGDHFVALPHDGGISISQGGREVFNSHAGARGSTDPRFHAMRAADFLQQASPTKMMGSRLDFPRGGSKTAGAMDEPHPISDWAGEGTCSTCRRGWNAPAHQEYDRLRQQGITPPNPRDVPHPVDDWAGEGTCATCKRGWNAPAHQAWDEQQRQKREGSKTSGGLPYNNRMIGTPVHARPDGSRVCANCGDPTKETRPYEGSNPLLEPGAPYCADCHKAQFSYRPSQWKTGAALSPEVIGNDSSTPKAEQPHAGTHPGGGPCTYCGQPVQAPGHVKWRRQNGIPQTISLGLRHTATESQVPNNYGGGQQQGMQGGDMDSSSGDQGGMSGTNPMGPGATDVGAVPQTTKPRQMPGGGGAPTPPQSDTFQAPGLGSGGFPAMPPLPAGVQSFGGLMAAIKRDNPDLPLGQVQALAHEAVKRYRRA